MMHGQTHIKFEIMSDGFKAVEMYVHT
jgi:hypothetical protein